MRYSTAILVICLLLLSLSSGAQARENVFLSDHLKNHVSFFASDSLEGRGLGTRGKVLAKNYIAEQFRLFGLRLTGDDYFQDFQTRMGVAWVSGTNVVGYLPGSDPGLKSEYILVGAHYDHIGYEYIDGRRVIYPGADDNASGTAVVIEMARYFSQNPELIGRSIIFIAFDAEESGLIGAEKFISENQAFGMEKIRAMISLDMVGMYKGYGGLDMKGMGTVHGGVEIAERIALENDINLKSTSAEFEYRTDTRPFAETGIPAIHAFTGTLSPYHKPGDTYDLLDYEGMAKVTEYLTALVLEMSSMPEINPSKRFAALLGPVPVRFNAGFLANAGRSHHRYEDDFFRAKSVFALSTGIFMQIHAGKIFSLQPEVIYDYNGSKSPSGVFRRRSFTTPVNLQLNLVNMMGGQIRLYSFTGGYFRFTMSGNDASTDLDFNSMYPDKEWGINLGLGADIMKIQFNYTWRRGLTNIFPESASTVFGSGHYLTLGYKIW